MIDPQRVSASKSRKRTQPPAPAAAPVSTTESAMYSLLRRRVYLADGLLQLRRIVEKAHPEFDGPDAEIRMLCFAEARALVTLAILDEQEKAVEKIRALEEQERTAPAQQAG